METSKLSKGSVTLILVSLFLSTMCTMGDMVIVPIAGNLYDVFDNVMLVNAIISAPAVTGLLFCLIGGRMVDKMDKKFVMILGFVIFTLSSVFGAVIENVYYVLICRLLATGVAWGLTSTAALGILADMFLDEEKHGMVVGWYNAAMAAIGAVLSFVAGNLALSGWKTAYNTYWAAIPVLVMLILFLPSAPPKQLSGNSDKTAKGAAGWYKPLLPLCGQVFFIGAAYYVIVYVIAVYVADAGIGNEAFSGTLSSIGTIASCLACMSFGVVYTKLKKATPLPSFFLIAAGFFLMAAFPNRAIAVICCAVMGASWGIFYSYFYAHCTEIVPEQMQGTALGIVGAVSGIASFFCTYMVTGLQSVMGVTSSVGVWPAFGVISLVVAVLSVIGYVKTRK